MYRVLAKLAGGPGGPSSQRFVANEVCEVTVGFANEVLLKCMSILICILRVCLYICSHRLHWHTTAAGLGQTRKSSACRRQY